jgi:hypothetical protein
MDVLGAGGDSLTGRRRQLVAGHREMRTLGAATSAVETDLQHDAIFAGRIGEASWQATGSRARSTPAD